MRAWLVLALFLLPLSTAEAKGGRYQERLTHRPRLALDGRDPAHLQRVLTRIDGQQEPWASGYRHLLQRVAGQVVDHRQSGWKRQSDKWNALYSEQTRNGEVATAKALLAYLASKGLDPSWLPLPRLPGEQTPLGWAKQQAAEARRIIERMYDDWPCWRGFGVVNRGIVAADSLAMHCAAFDLLAALPRTWRGKLDTAEKRLGDLASDLRFWFWTVATYRSNHGMRVASGLGLAAITINRHDRYRWWKPGTWWHKPKGWMRCAERNLHPVGRRSDYRYQGRLGAWAEGSGYMQYTHDLVLPFFFAHARFNRGSGVPFLASDTTNRLIGWGIELRMPDGRRPQIDNSGIHRTPSPGYLVSRIAGGARSPRDQQVAAWDYAHNDYPGLKSGRRVAFLLGAYDPPLNLVAAPPSLDPTRIMTGRGGAVLRTDWSEDAAHVVVQAQRGELRKHGGGHESVANGAYAFYAHRDLITIDPGYFGFSQVERTNRARHRSMVLVDGRGPRPAHLRLGFLGWVSGGEDTEIVSGARTRTAAPVRAVQVRSRYRKADVERTVALIERRYLLVEDRCRSRKTKTFTSQVQLNAGPSKGRTVQRSGAVVRYETATRRVQVCVAAGASPALTPRMFTQASRNGDSADDNRAVAYDARGKDVTFLTAIAVAAPGAAPPAVTPLVVGNGAAALLVVTPGASDLVVSNPRRARIQIPARTGTRALVTTHALVVVSFDAVGAGRTVWAVGPGQVQY